MSQLLVAEVHRRVVMEYLRSVMRGRIICTSMKMRRRMAGRLRDEGKQIKVLFKDLVSEIFGHAIDYSSMFLYDCISYLISLCVRSLRPAGWTALCPTSQRSSSWKTFLPSRWRLEFWSESFQMSGMNESNESTSSSFSEWAVNKCFLTDWTNLFVVQLVHFSALSQGKHWQCSVWSAALQWREHRAVLMLILVLMLMLGEQEHQRWN